MGIYSIPCRQCGQIFAWFSGNTDQRCATCKDAEVKAVQEHKCECVEAHEPGCRAYQ